MFYFKKIWTQTFEQCILVQWYIMTLFHLFVLKGKKTYSV